MGTRELIRRLGRGAKRIERAVVERALFEAARRRRAREVALLLESQIERPRRSADRSGSVRILALKKPAFTEDLRASFEPDPRFELAFLRRRALKAVGRAFLGEHINDFTYRTEDPADLRAMAEYRGFLIDVFARLLGRSRFDVVMTGNFAYWAEQELAAAVEELGAAFVVLFKECLNTPGLERFWEWMYREGRSPFQGRKILVYNRETRDLLTRSAIAPPERIAITGMPRLDRAFTLRPLESNAARPRQLLFLVFSSTTGLPEVDPKRRRIPDQFLAGNFAELAEESYGAIEALARELPDVRVVVKAKEAVGHQSVLSRRFSGVGQPRNLEVVRGGDVLQHIEGSDVVCGFKSTALLEALAAGRPVVVPRFAEALRPELADFLLDLGSSGQIARSRNELVVLLRSYLFRERPLPELADVAPVLDRWLGNADGRAGDRVRAEVLSLLGR